MAPVDTELADSWPNQADYDSVTDIFERVNAGSVRS